MKKLLVSLLILGTTALYFGQTVTTAVFTDVVNFTGNGTNNLFQTDAILPPGSPTNIASTTPGSPTTVTTASSNYLANGDTVVIAGATVGAVNGTWTVSGVTPTAFTIPVTTGSSGGAAGTVTRPITAKVEAGNGGYVDISAAQTPSTFATGHRIYRAPATPFSSITSSSTAVGGFTTITTGTAHRLSAGDTVVITGHSGSTPVLNGRYTVAASPAPTATTFAIAVNVSAGGTGGVVYRVDPTISIVSSSAGPTVTITMAQAHGLAVNDIVTISGNSQAVLNSTFQVLGVGTNTFTVTASPAGTGAGGQVFKNVRQQTILTSSVAVGGYTTITTAAPHGLAANDKVWITGHTGSSPAVSGLYTVASAPAPTARTFAIAVNVTTAGTGGSIVRAMTSAITSSSAGNPTTITTPAPHGLVTGDTVFIDGHSGGTTVAISSISTASPPLVTTASPAGLTQGQQVTISGSNSTPSVDGTWTVSSVSGNTFTIPASVTGAGTVAGSATNAIYGSYTATVTSATTFTIPVNVTTPGTGGQFYRVPKANILSSSLASVTGITSTTAGSPTTVTTATSPGLSNGQTVFISGNSNSSVNGTWVVSSVSGSGPYTFTIPVNTTSSGAGTGGSVSTGTTITTTLPHRLLTGDKIFIADHSGSTPPIAGQYTVAAALTTTTLLLNADVTVAGAGGTVTGPWVQVGSDMSPLATVNYVDSSPGQGVLFYTVRAYYSGQGSIWESPNSNIVGASILNDFGVTMPNPISTTFSVPSTGNPVSLTVPSTAGFFTGDAVTVTLTGPGYTTPTVTGQWTATVVDATHLTIPVTVTALNGSPVGNVERGPTVAINGSSVGNPTTITMATNHNLTTGAIVTIYGHTSTPDINGQWPVTVLSPTTFTIPVSVDVAGTGGRIGDFDQTAGTDYSVTARARTADGATLVPFTGASTLSVTSGQPGTLACTPACASQKPTAGVLTYTEKITDAPTATTTLHVASDTVPSRAGDGKAFNVAPASFYVGDTVTISGNTKASPTSVTTSAAHGLATGNTVAIRGSNSVPSIDGVWSVTVTSATTFTIPVNVTTTAGTTGIVVTPTGQEKSGTAFTMGVAALDSAGVLLNTFTGSPTLSASPSPAPAANPATITCTSSCTQAAVAGVAAYTATVTNAPWSTMLRGTYSSGVLTPQGDSAAFTVGPASFTLSTPATQTKDAAWSGTVTATAKDSLAATATTFVGSTTLSASPNSCTSGCTVTAVAGVATFNAMVMSLTSPTDAMTVTATYTGSPTNTAGTSAAFRVNGKDYFALSGSGNSAGTKNCSASGFNDLDITNPGGSWAFTANKGHNFFFKNMGFNHTSADAGVYTVTISGTAVGANIDATVLIGSCSGTRFTNLPGTTGILKTITTGGGTYTFTFPTTSSAVALNTTNWLAVEITLANTGTSVTLAMNGSSYVTGPFH